MGKINTATTAERKQALQAHLDRLKAYPTTAAERQLAIGGCIDKLKEVEATIKELYPQAGTNSKTFFIEGDTEVSTQYLVSSRNFLSTLDFILMFEKRMEVDYA